MWAKTALFGIALWLTALTSQAAINLDRTRIIFNSTDKSASVILQTRARHHLIWRNLGWKIPKAKNRESIGGFTPYAAD